MILPCSRPGTTLPAAPWYCTSLPVQYSWLWATPQDTPPLPSLAAAPCLHTTGINNATERKNPKCKIYDIFFDFSSCSHCTSRSSSYLGWLTHLSRHSGEPSMSEHQPCTLHQDRHATCGMEHHERNGSTCDIARVRLCVGGFAGCAASILRTLHHCALRRSVALDTSRACSHTRAAVEAEG